MKMEQELFKDSVVSIWRLFFLFSLCSCDYFFYFQVLNIISDNFRSFVFITVSLFFVFCNWKNIGCGYYISPTNLHATFLFTKFWKYISVLKCFIEHFIFKDIYFNLYHFLQLFTNYNYSLFYYKLFHVYNSLYLL